MTTKDKDQLIQDLSAINQELLEGIKWRDQIIHDLRKIAQDAIQLSNSRDPLNERSKNIGETYVTNVMLLRAREKDKRATFFLLKLIKSRLINETPIIGAIRDYLISAIGNYSAKLSKIKLDKVLRRKSLSKRPWLKGPSLTP